MANTNPQWYCPQCDTKYEQKKQYCSYCTDRVMLRFKCRTTHIDDLYSHFVDRHITQCYTCKQYHKSTDINIANTRRQRITALEDTTKGMYYTIILLIVLCIIMYCSYIMITI
jgi:hypothetical protein